MEYNKIMLNFYKYEGAGNDFIMINNMEGNISLNPEKIKFLCDRHKGIGADGLILVEKSDKPGVSCFMNYNNSDGTMAEMCGNGVRCTAKFYLDFVRHDLTNEKQDHAIKEVVVETRSGIKKITLHEDGTFSTDMGVPVFDHPDIPNQPVEIEGYNFNSVMMGVPHTVTFVKNLDDIDIRTIGPKIETNLHFPNKTNVEFVEKIDDTHYKVKVWERGCGETLACGTGSCAIYSIINRLSARKVLAEEITLEFKGGKLFLSQNEQGHVILRGPAKFVFKGEC